MKLHSHVRNVNAEHNESLTALDRFALATTDHIGTMGFFFIIALWTFGWILWNMLAPTPLRFDPFPAFAMWLFVSNVLQLLFLPLIMIGQNLQGRHSEARAQADYEVNVQAEKEIKKILRHLEKQDAMSLEILRRLEG